MKSLAILGASGHGKVVADIALSSGEWDNIVFFDDAYPSLKVVADWKVNGTRNDLMKNHEKFSGVIVAIGNNEIRSELQFELTVNGCNIIKLIHPSAIVSKYSSIGLGTVIMPGVVINAFATIGEACIINSNVLVEHDCNIGDGVHISPGSNVAGSVHIGCRAWIGLGCNIKQSLSICSDVIIGAGGLVLKDIESPGTYVGAPVKKLNTESKK